MSVASELERLRQAEEELRKTRCASCGHQYASHSRFSENCLGPLDGNRRCLCAGFKDGR